MTPPNEKPLEYWITKGTSNFCSEKIFDYELENYVKAKTDGFYDIVSTEDTVEDGIHVIEYSAYKALQSQLEKQQDDYTQYFLAESDALREIISKLETQINAERLAADKLADALSSVTTAIRRYNDANHVVEWVLARNKKAIEALAEYRKMRGGQ